jgi:uncharacterized protein
VTRYFWDQFGPDAERTAQHFQRHLESFLRENACAGCSTGIESRGPGHCAAYCDTPPEHEPLIQRALRPRRSE